MGFSAKILADSISRLGFRLTTFETTFPRIVLAELNTHRMLSRNSASSRAIPVEKMLRRLAEDPYIPSTWGKNQKGMQAIEEILGEDAMECERNWLMARDMAVMQAEKLMRLGVHKQLTNRLLEPFLWHTAIITATEWDNLWHLRVHKDAHPDIRTPVAMMQDLFVGGHPEPVDDGRWHTPLIDVRDDALEGENEETIAQVSIGRCARVSYLTHDGKRDHTADIDLFNKLEGPGHMSPFEHAARPMTHEEAELFARPELIWDKKHKEWIKTGKTLCFLGNYQGWVQYRKLIPGEWDIHGWRTENSQ